MDTRTYSSDIAFTPAVKALQTRRGSRAAYARMERAGAWQTGITPQLKEFIEAQDSVFLATANAQGQPYIQHRGGPPGFLHVLDDHDIGFVDFVGNRQYITAGNLAENPRVHLFLMDYAHQQRVKIWGEARIIEDDATLTTRLMPPGYKARVSHVMLITVAAWDANCPQHIPQRIDGAAVAAALAERDERIRVLQTELHKLRAGQLQSG